LISTGFIACSLILKRSFDL